MSLCFKYFGCLCHSTAYFYLQELLTFPEQSRLHHICEPLLISKMPSCSCSLFALSFHPHTYTHTHRLPLWRFSLLLPATLKLTTLSFEPSLIHSPRSLLHPELCINFQHNAWYSLLHLFSSVCLPHQSCVPWQMSPAEAQYHTCM